MDLMEVLSERSRLVDRALEEALDLNVQKKLYDAMRHLPLAGGKRLRPALAMVVADAINGSGMRTLPFGVALEITHNFTLIHDDLMDRDDLRRSVITVHKAYDEATAINAGDVLFARAFEVLTDLDCDDRIFREIVGDLARTVRLIGEGQQLDMDFGRQEHVTEEDALLMVKLKTAVLFETAAKGAALIAGADERLVEDMKGYGLNLGIGFQLHDDLLDIIGEERTTGKPRWSDLREGKKTVILIHALEHAAPKDRDLILRTIGRPDVTNEEIAQVVDVLNWTGSIVYAQTLTRRYAEKAKEYLFGLEESEHKDLLVALADFTITREK